MTVLHKKTRRYSWFLRPSRWIGFLILLAWVGVLFMLHRRQSLPSGEDITQLYPWVIQEKLSAATDWMGIYLRGNKIGYVQISTTPKDKGFEIVQRSRMVLRVMGTKQQLDTLSKVWVDSRYRIQRFLFRLYSPMSRFKATGSIVRSKLHIRLTTGRNKRTLTLPYRPALLSSALRPYLASQKLPPGKRFRTVLFDPQSLSYRPTVIEVEAYETLTIQGKPIRALRYKQSYRGLTMRAWLDDQGRPLKEASSTGMVLLRESPRQARQGIRSGQDIILATSILPNQRIRFPTVRKKLQVRLLNVPLASFPALYIGRQQLTGGILTIQKEELGKRFVRGGHHSMPANGAQRTARSRPSGAGPLPTSRPAKQDEQQGIQEALQATPLVQSDHPLIKRTALRIVKSAKNRLARIRALVSWVHVSLQKKNVLGIPSALEILQNRVGDCNEHATLLAALSRSLGLPARIVTGVAYQHGRFFYHAWNECYLGQGRWLSVDATWGQIPADVTHIALVHGGISKQIALLQAIGKLRIHIVSSKRRSP